MRKGMEKFIVTVWFHVLDKEGVIQSLEPRIKITQGKRWHAANVIIKAFEKQMSPKQCYAIYSVSFTPVANIQGIRTMLRNMQRLTDVVSKRSSSTK